jgi:hypothetical protein
MHIKIAKLAEIKPITNPETEQYCLDVAAKYKAIVDEHGTASAGWVHESQRLNMEVDNWVAERRLVRWEVLALRERIGYLIKVDA